MTLRIHLTGAAGAGVSTLGKAVATKLDLPFVDSDDHYWAPVDPPFSVKKAPADRLSSMSAALGQGAWVLAGSCGAWGKPVTDLADLVVFVYTPTAMRMARLKNREHLRYGARIEPGGDMYRINQAFMDWARAYDDPCFSGRSLAGHEFWLSQQKAPVLRLDGSLPVGALLRDVTGFIGRLQNAA